MSTIKAKPKEGLFKKLSLDFQVRQNCKFTQSKFNLIDGSHSHS